MFQRSTSKSFGFRLEVISRRWWAHREPTHPGEMLLEEFLKPMGLSQQQLARAVRVPYQRVNELINRRRGITPSTALRLARFFGNGGGSSAHSFGACGRVKVAFLCLSD